MKFMEYMRFKVNVYCNSDYIKNEVLKNKFRYIEFKEIQISHEDGNFVEIKNMSMEDSNEEVCTDYDLQWDICVLHLDDKSFNPEKFINLRNKFGRVFITGNIDDNKLTELIKNDTLRSEIDMYIPNVEDCINFIKLYYYTQNSDHMMGYCDIDFFTDGNKIISSIITEDFNSIEEFLENCIKVHSENYYVIFGMKNNEGTLFDIQELAHKIDSKYTIDESLLYLWNINEESQDKYYYCFFIDRGFVLGINNRELQNSMEF